MTHPADLDRIDAYVAHLSTLGHPDTTTQTYRAALNRAARELPAGLCAVPDELLAWLATLRSASARQTYRAALRGFYDWAINRGGLQGANPAAGLPTVRRKRGLPRPCTLDELATILDRARQPVRLWAMLAAYAGTRCCEIARLRREDVTETMTWLHGKGDKQRQVPTHPAVWAAVAGLPPGLLAGGRNAHCVSHRGAAEFDRIGLPEVTLHRLRHLAGTLWQAATGDVRVTQELLGHASVATTMVYTAVSNTQMRAAVLAVPTLSASAAAAGRG